MIKTQVLNILGRQIALKPIDQAKLKGVTIGDKLSYTFLSGSYMDVEMLFLKPKAENPTPRVCDITARRLSEKTDMPIVFILKNGPTYERQRLLDKGVFFVMSEKFAHLPMLMAMEKMSNRKAARQLSVVAQYMLLYHLQVGSIAGLTARQMQTLLPYSYASITLGMTCLEDLGLARKVVLEDKTKVLEFEYKGAKLWEASREFLNNPVERRIYCDELRSDEDHIVAGVNALSHYSILNPDKERIIAMTGRQFKELEKANAIVGLNPYDGNIVVEVWKYQPITINDNKYADPLSLFLSLDDDDDPRVEGEVERMMNKITWKD